MSVQGPEAAAGGLSVRLRKRLRDERGTALLLDVQFTASSGFNILFGASGAGKTTLLDCIAGLLTPEEGHITVGGSVLYSSEQGTNLPPRRREVGYLLQSLALFPHMTVQQNVEYGLHALTAAERERRVGEVLSGFRIVHLARRHPGEISGGERQRAALARTLVTHPRVLLLDEPLSALDAATKSQIVADLRAWNNRNPIPVLYVTHSRQEVFALAEQVLVLEAGAILARGTPQEALDHPRSERVAQLVGFENIFDARVTELHPTLGTMACQIEGSSLELEVPLVAAEKSSLIRLGLRAGDILLAIAPPQGLSARNIVPGNIVSLQQTDVTVEARVCCGPTFVVHLTPGARDALELRPGRQVWLVVKTYSCHVLQ